jgi:uncharacterized protein (TIGR03000 family)
MMQAPGKGGAAEKIGAPKKTEKSTGKDGQARLIIEVPADAKLYVDDQLMKTTSNRRVFSTPPLEDGLDYYYILRAEVVKTTSNRRVFSTPPLEDGLDYYYILRTEVVRDGETMSQTKRVIVRAGEETRATFPELSSEKVAQVDTGSKR